MAKPHIAVYFCSWSLDMVSEEDQICGPLQKKFIIVCCFLVGAFRRKTQTIVVTSFFKDQRTDRFYKFYKLTD